MLYVLEAGLTGLGQAGIVLSISSAILTWAAAALFPPATAEGQIRLCIDCGGKRQSGQLPLPLSDQPESSPPQQVLVIRRLRAVGQYRSTE